MTAALFSLTLAWSASADMSSARREEQGTSTGNPKLVPYESLNLSLQLKRPKDWLPPIETTNELTLTSKPDLNENYLTIGSYSWEGADLLNVLQGWKPECVWTKRLIADRAAFYCKGNMFGLLALMRSANRVVIIRFSVSDAPSATIVDPILNSLKFLDLTTADPAAR